MDERQVPGNVRAADPWSFGNVGMPGACEGCVLPCCQQAVAIAG